MGKQYLVTVHEIKPKSSPSNGCETLFFLLLGIVILCSCPFFFWKTQYIQKWVASIQYPNRQKIETEIYCGEIYVEEFCNLYGAWFLDTDTVAFYAGNNLAFVDLRYPSKIRKLWLTDTHFYYYEAEPYADQYTREVESNKRWVSIGPEGWQAPPKRWKDEELQKYLSPSWLPIDGWIGFQSKDGKRSVYLSHDSYWYFLETK